MTAVDDESATGFSLRRWSRRKLAAARAPTPAEAPAAVGKPLDPARPDAGEGTAVAATAAAPVPSAAGAGEAAPGANTAPLPPIDALGIDSDFTPFLRPQVDESLRRQALRKLFQDPRFNVMDGLDIYIDDYTQMDPIPPAMLQHIAHAQALLAPPVLDVDAPEATGSGAPDSLTVAATSGAVAGAAQDASAAVPAPAAAAEPPPDAAAPAFLPAADANIPAPRTVRADPAVEMQPARQRDETVAGR